MQAVPALNLQNNPGRNVSGSLGYNLRYWQWKSNIDTGHAGGILWHGLRERRGQHLNAIEHYCQDQQQKEQQKYLSY
jgi:hypothetical protein